VIVADEAYVEFSDAPEGMIPHLKAHDNLVVLRTLSKAHALAGERIGTVIAHPALIAMMQKILAAYPLPRSAVAAALAALSPEGLAQSAHYRQVVVKERERLAAAFRQHSEVVKIFPSVGNFLLLEVKNPKIFMKTAADNGILLRNRESDVPNCVRFSVGRCEQNDRLLAAFGLL
jgi:histidinol-phosphate aminotransferase